VKLFGVAEVVKCYVVVSVAGMLIVYRGLKGIARVFVFAGVTRVSS